MTDYRIGRKLALMCLIAQKNSICTIDSDMDELKEMLRDIHIGKSDLWKEVGLTKVEAKEFFDAMLNDTMDVWAKEHDCYWD